MTKNEERLYQWAVNNHKEFMNTCGQESNWHIRNTEGDRLEEYDIETLKDIQEYLEKARIEKDAALIFSAEAAKWKMQYFVEKESESVQCETGLPTSQDIPDFVYRF